MKTLEEYQSELKLFDFEMPCFKKFLEDPNQKEYYAPMKMVSKNDDGSLQLDMAQYNCGHRRKITI